MTFTVPPIKTVFSGLFTVALLAIAGASIWFGVSELLGAARTTVAEPPVPVPNVLLPAGAAAADGNPSARVAMVVFSDFDCPFCAKFARETLPEIRREYAATGKIRLMFRHYPLNIHPRAKAAAVSAVCSDRQGKFWEMHDRLFERDRYQPVSPESIAQTLGLDMASFTECGKDGKAAAQVTSDMSIAGELGLDGTPVSIVGIVNGNKIKPVEMVVGAQPLIAFRSALERALSQSAR